MLEKKWSLKEKYRGLQYGYDLSKEAVIVTDVDGIP